MLIHRTGNNDKVGIVKYELEVVHFYTSRNAHKHMKNKIFASSIIHITFFYTGILNITFTNIMVNHASDRLVRSTLMNQ